MTVEELQAQLNEMQTELEKKEAANARLLADVNKHRTRADELERERTARAETEAKALTLEEQIAALKGEVTGMREAAEVAAAEVAAEKERATRAERLAFLTGKVADPVLALAVLKDEHLADDGGINVEALTEAHPTLKPAEPRGVDLPSARGIPGARTPSKVQQALHRAQQGDRATAAALLASTAFVGAESEHK